MTPITINYNVDSPGCVPTCTLTITCNEMPSIFTNLLSAFWNVTGPNSLLLLANRNPLGIGRTYTITITCTNSAGTVTAQIPVIVPIVNLLSASTPIPAQITLNRDISKNKIVGSSSNCKKCDKDKK